MDYLSFEKPIEELENQLTKALELANETGVDMAKTITDIQQKLDNAKKEIYNNLSAWERVQLSRHPQRPYTMAYINALTQGDFIEMHGDRGVKDDKAMVGGWGSRWQELHVHRTTKRGQHQDASIPQLWDG